MKMIIGFFSLCISFCAFAAEEPSAKDGVLNENQELPQILYVVPWKDVENTKGVKQKLVLHDFFTDLYDPLLPADVIAPTGANLNVKEKTPADAPKK